MRAESRARVAELLVWVSGEADLIHAELEPRVTDPATDHYDLTTQLRLNGCLDHFECHMGIRDLDASVALQAPAPGVPVAERGSPITGRSDSGRRRLHGAQDGMFGVALTRLTVGTWNASCWMR